MTKRGKWIGIGVAIVVLVAGGGWVWSMRMCCSPPPEDCCVIAVPAVPLDAVTLFTGIADAMVAIEARFETGSTPVVQAGTGFTVTTDGWLVTAAGLLERPAGARGRPAIVAIFRTGMRVPVSDQKLGDGVALLKIALPAALPVLRLQPDSMVAPGTRPFLAGYSEHPVEGRIVEPEIARGLVTDGATAGGQLRIDAAAGRRFRGAPVFDAWGGVVAILIEMEPGSPNRWIAVPVNRLGFLPHDDQSGADRGTNR